MKKTRKVLSLVLALALAFSSMPSVYIGVAATNSAVSDTGTLDDPTKPVKTDGIIKEEDICKLNAESKSTEYTFYQTKDNEYFTFVQTKVLQHIYEVDVLSRTLTVEEISFYEGASGVNGQSGQVEISSGNGLQETPIITQNKTKDFISKYWVSNTWSATNTNANGAGQEPKNVKLSYDFGSFEGNKVYTWQNDVVFHGHTANENGEISTGYYESLKWNWVSGDNSARCELRIGTTIRVLDARELVKEMAEVEDILDNSDDYTKEYISSVEATLNTIPDDLRDFSTVYSQSEIDRYTQMLKDVSLNSADYTEFNTLYKALKKISNAKGAYTEESFNVFKVEIAQINEDLPKNLDKTQQATVDAATQALKDAYDKLITTDLSDSEDSYYFQGTENSGYVNITVKNVNLKFMQTKDNQEFKFTQNWTLQRTGGTNKRIIYRVTLDESLPLYCGNTSCQSNPNLTENKTSDFISRMNTGYTTRTAADADGTSFTAKEFSTWASDAADGDQKLVNNGIIGGEFGLSEETYNATVSPTFVGNSASQSGEISTNFVQRIGYKYYTGVFQYKYRHFHINSTITVTDVRQLISAVADAKETITNPGTHSENYISALQAAVDSVPVEMLTGVEYYTQAEVDKFYNDITTIPEDVADYSEFVEVFESMLAENSDKYTQESYIKFIDEIYAINQALPKDLTADEQATIDAAVDALYDAYDKLVSSHLNKDDVFTEEDIPGALGNSPLRFSLATTQYNFMQIADGQKFALRTDLTVRNTRSNYNLYLRGLGFSVVTPDALADYCLSDDGCHNVSAITSNQTEIVAGAVTGVNALTYANGVVVADGAGNITEHNTWINTEGTAISSGGLLIDNVKLSSEDSSAHAEIYYTGPSGNQEELSGFVDATYAFWLGWYYVEPIFGSEKYSDELYRHVHIPVNVKITDARALNSLYERVEDIVSGKEENNYTFASLMNLYNAFKATDKDIAYGNEFASQEVVNAQYAELKAAFDALKEGADYSEYFETYVKAEEIINSNNVDSRGNNLYDDEAYEGFVETVTNINNALSKDLDNSEENQAIIDKATQDIRNAIAALELTKRADYSELNDAMTEAEEILNAPKGTYTDKTLEKVQEAYNNAVELDKNLPASEQGQVDAITEALKDAVENKEYKADYSEYDQAYDIVKDIIDNPDKYTDETVKAAQDAMNTAGGINKDLADTAANREIIKEATDVLNNVVINGVRKADYSEFNEAYKAVEEIANDTTGKFTDATIQAAKDSLVEADKLDKNLPLSEANQAIVDAAKDALQAVIDNAQFKADYSEYNDAKADADAIINAGNLDANGNPIYKQDAFDAYKDAVENIDNNLGKDLPVSEQAKVDEATEKLKELKAELEKTTGYDIVILDPETTVEEVLGDYDYDDEVIIEFKDYTGKELAGIDFVGTGSTMKVILKSTGEILDYKLFIIKGDVSGDGKVNADDYSKSISIVVGGETYPEEHKFFFTANDMDDDGYIDAIDIALIRRMYR